MSIYGDIYIVSYIWSIYKSPHRAYSIYIVERGVARGGEYMARESIVGMYGKYSSSGVEKGREVRER